MFIERGSGKFENRFGNIIFRSFNWDVVVFFEVDVSVLFGWIVGSIEEFVFDVGVGWIRDVFVVFLLVIVRVVSSVVIVGVVVVIFMIIVVFMVVIFLVVVVWIVVGCWSVVV